MQKMTDLELNARIGQFMERKRGDFPELFSHFDALHSSDRSLRGQLPMVRSGMRPL